MQKRTLSQRSKRLTSEETSSLLLSLLCPIRGFWRGKRYTVNTQNGNIFYQAAWRSFEGIRKRRARSRARWQAEMALPKRHPTRIAAIQRKRIYDANPEVVLKRNDRAKAKQKLKCGAERRIETMQRIALRNNDIEHARKVWRKWYDRNREEYCLDEKRRRSRRDPTYGLASLAHQFRRGEITIDELDRRYREAFARLHEINREGLREVPHLERLPNDQCGR